MSDEPDIPFDDPPAKNGTNGIVNVALSIGSAHHNRTTDGDLFSVIAEISSDKWRPNVEEIRRVATEVGSAARSDGLAEDEVADLVKSAIDPLKKDLPAVLWSGTFSKRANDSLIQHSGLVHVDLDKLGDRVAVAREQIIGDPHTFHCAISPSGGGLKVVYRCDPAREHMLSFRAAERYVLQEFGLTADPSCKDVARLCFLTWDPNAYFNPNAIPLEYPQEPTAFASPVERMPGARLTAGLEPWDDYDLRGDLPALLISKGWTAAGKHGWTRPGKTTGISATLGKVPGRFYVFTSSTEFEANHTYRPWHVYAILNHGGDWKRAVAALRKEGYGAEAARPKPTPPASDHSSNGKDVYDPGYEEPQNGVTQSPTEDPSAKIKPFTLWAPSQFLAFVPDPSACLLGTGYVELGQWTSLIGIGGLGKTRLALWLVICQILKRRWCDIPTNGVPQKSVILSTENGLRRWKEDLTKILGTLSDAERAVIEGHVRILAMTDDEDGDLCLGNPESVSRLKLTLTAATPGIVVFDPFADMMEGDENKTVDLVATTTKLRSITRSCCPKAAVLIIHHGRTGSANIAQAGDQFNAGNFGRGAKALYSKVRCEIQLAPEDRDNPNRLVLACGKANDTVKFAPRCIVFQEDDFSYRVDPSFDIDAWRDDVSGKRKKSTVSIADVVAAVAEKCPFAGDETDTKTVFAFFEGSGVPERTLQHYVKLAVDDGYLRRGKKRWSIRLGAKPLPKS